MSESRTYQDILEQGRSLPQTMETLNEDPLPAGALAEKRRFIFTGCGSSYYAGVSAAALLRMLSGVDARAVPASELWLLPEENILQDSVVVGISRTGTTTEVVRALETARQLGATTLAISIGSEPETFKLADLTIWLPHAGERAPAMTQSFSNLLLAAQHVAVEIADALDAPEADSYRKGLGDTASGVSGIINDLDSRARKLAATKPKHVVFLGSGPHQGICAEAALKVQEMARLPVESYAPLEFRHGPVASVSGDSLIVILSTPTSQPFDKIISADAELLGVPLVQVAAGSLTGTNQVGADGAGGGLTRIPLSLPEWLMGNAALPFLQLCAYHLTIGLDQNPESIRYLDRSKKTHLDPHVVDLAVNPHEKQRA